MDKPKWADQQIDHMLNSLESWENKYGFNERQCTALTKLQAVVANGKARGLSGLSDRLGDYLRDSPGVIHRGSADRTAT